MSGGGVLLEKPEYLTGKVWNQLPVVRIRLMMSSVLRNCDGLKDFGSKSVVEGV